MRKTLIILTGMLLFAALSIPVYSQTGATVTGTVKNSKSGEKIAAVSITVKGAVTGTYTDDKGNFKLFSIQKPPFTIVVSSVGYANREVNIESSGQTVNVELEPTYVLGEDIVVAASRLPERILESPVSIERISSAAIRNAPASSYYDVIANVKGVDVTTASLTFKTITTRGFNTSGNTRFNQIVDGMDNQAPGLNFSVGSVIGLTELDVESMELLEGASSALYGPGGMNGTLLITSKSPFKYQGLSVQVREGVMHIDDPFRDVSPYHDLTFRWGQKLSDKFAFKIGAQYILAKDWLARDTSDYLSASGSATARVIPVGTRYTDPNYDGVNVYGDETSLDINDATTPFLLGATGGDPTAISAITPFLAGPLPVSRTGYLESDVVPPNTINFKVSGGLYYKIKPDLELSLIGYYGTGNSVYTGSDRYALKDLKVGQYKLELKSNKWFVRGYTTQENSGESYNATVTSQLFNEAWKPSYNPLDPANSWYPQFSGALVGGSLAIYAPVYADVLTQTGDPVQANAAAQEAVAENETALLYGARTFADQGRPAPGSSQFNQIFDAVRLKPIPYGGKFLDKTDLYMAEGQYNLTDVFKIGNVDNRTEFLIGANFKEYVLNSQGTLFADSAGTIGISEFGSYLQVSQRLFNDVLKLTASGRYDKNENFKGRFTPRVSAVISVAKDHNIRLSYQTAYRFPTTQNQWINLGIGGGVTLIGGLPELRDFYNFDGNPVYTQASFNAFAATGDPTQLKVQQFGEYKPESSNSFEMGYKGLINNKLLIDAYAYFAKYQNFLGRIVVFQSSDGTPLGLGAPNVFSVSVNSSSKVSTNGWGLSLDYLLPNNFFINGNVFSDVITNVPSGFISYFNTPEYRFNTGFGNNGLGKTKRFGFNIIYRWQDAFFYQSDFRQGTIPSFGTLDAQVNYKFSKEKIMLKLGGTNITNHYYRNAFGNPYVGALYYISIGYNVF